MYIYILKMYTGMRLCIHAVWTLKVCVCKCIFTRKDIYAHACTCVYILCVYLQIRQTHRVSILKTNQIQSQYLWSYKFTQRCMHLCICIYILCVYLHMLCTHKLQLMITKLCVFLHMKTHTHCGSWQPNCSYTYTWHTHTNCSSW